MFGFVETPSIAQAIRMRLMPSNVHDWYLRDWMASLRVTQAKLVEITGFTKTKISFLANGKQPYNRDILNTVAWALNLQPFELLLHPEDANRLRQYRDSAVKLAAAESRQAYGPPPTEEAEEPHRING